MRSERRLRRLVVDGTVYRWTVRHRHGDGDPCRQVLTLNRDGVATRIVFRSGAGRVVCGGYWHSGLVADGNGHSVNLHEPGVVRAFVDEVGERGLEGGEVDGWEVLPPVAVSRAAGATPGARPDCPPGP